MRKMCVCVSVFFLMRKSNRKHLNAKASQTRATLILDDDDHK